MVREHVLHSVLEIYLLSLTEGKFAKSRGIVKDVLGVTTTADIGTCVLRNVGRSSITRDTTMRIGGVFICFVDLTQHLGHVGTSIRHVVFLVFILSYSLHLFLHFPENRCGSGRHGVEVFHVEFVELVTQVFLNGLYEVVQISQVVHRLRIRLPCHVLQLTLGLPH